MLLILIKDLVRKRSFCCVEESDVLGSSSPSTGVLTFWGEFNSARVTLQPRSKSSVLHAATGIREPRERGWLRSRSSLRTLTYFRSS